MEERRAVTRPPHDGSARTDCYERIRNVFKDRLTRYYREHPERIADRRGTENQEMVLSILRETFATLDHYIIFKKD